MLGRLKLVKGADLVADNNENDGNENNLLHDTLFLKYLVSPWSGLLHTFLPLLVLQKHCSLQMVYNVLASLRLQPVGFQNNSSKLLNLPTVVTSLHLSLFYLQ
jgi:hypothetical protein